MIARYKPLPDEPEPVEDFPRPTRPMAPSRPLRLLPTVDINPPAPPDVSDDRTDSFDLDPAGDFTLGWDAF